MGKNPPGYKAERIRRRVAQGLCRDCPGKLNLYKSLCDACGLKYRIRARAARNCKPWVKGKQGRPQKSED